MLVKLRVIKFEANDRGALSAKLSSGYLESGTWACRAVKECTRMQHARILAEHMHGSDMVGTKIVF